jgi:hypothetical protein
MKMGKAKRYDAFDGAPFSEKDSQETVKHMDLTNPQFGLKLSDSVVSIEIAPFNNLQFRLQNRQHICFEGNLIMLCKASCLVPYN